MCGIVGVVRLESSSVPLVLAQEILRTLLIRSQSRGKDSSGIAVLTDDSVQVFKRMQPVTELVKTSAYRDLVGGKTAKFVAVGHSRMETNGTSFLNKNNQPVIKGRCVLIHNGIVVNDGDLWGRHRDWTRESEVDSEVLGALLDDHLAPSVDVQAAVQKALSPIEGSFSIAALFERFDNLLLATNTGSLFLIYLPDQGFLAFASEFHFVEAIRKMLPAAPASAVRQIRAGTAAWVDLTSLDSLHFAIEAGGAAPAPLGKTTGAKLAVARPTLRVAKLHKDVESLDRAPALPNAGRAAELERVVAGEYQRVLPAIRQLRRCSRCILPESMPYISFDAQGVCNYCHNHQPRETRGLESLKEAVAPFRKGTGEADCIVSFSGGRDSSYALHYVKKELGLQPIAYSYDWGMLTDLGRRNQARMTGALGVEHLLVAADIHRKRRYIRQNVSAWLKSPQLGMVPLFMAGDKQYFYYLNKVREETGIKLVIYADNALEKTDFKYGFANVALSPEVGKAYNIGRFNSVKLLWYYARNYVANPGYLNSSLLDTFTAYLSSYVVPKEYVYLYRHILWEESEIEKTLLGDYGWELARDTTSTWRIGDGTAAFYNYIYYTMAGFTEQDTFRSNQIREGIIGRDEALKLAEIGNAPRIESILWYCDTIGIDAVNAIRAINGATKRFAVEGRR